MEENTLEQEYGKLKKKHSILPDFEKLDVHFEITEIECTKSILRDIRKKISEKVSSYCELIESIMQPETHIAALHEIKYMTEKERDVMYEIYSSFMKLNRYSLELGIENDDSKNAEFIKNGLEIYEAKKAKLKQVITFLKESWSKNDSAKEDIEYLR